MRGFTPLLFFKPYLCCFVWTMGLVIDKAVHTNLIKVQKKSRRES